MGTSYLEMQETTTDEFTCMFCWILKDLVPDVVQLLSVKTNLKNEGLQLFRYNDAPLFLVDMNKPVISVTSLST